MQIEDIRHANIVEKERVQRKKSDAANCYRLEKLSWGPGQAFMAKAWP